MTVSDRSALAAVLDRTAARKGPGGFTFGDLLEAGVPASASLSHVAAWLAEARSTGAVEDMGFDAGHGDRTLGPRRYRAVQSPDWDAPD